MNARELSNRLAELLRREHDSFADFVAALADFDQRRGWEALGYTSLFAFLHRELGLSKGSAYYRKVAADLVRRFPEVLAPLRDGRLCVTSVVELSKVLTPENREEVLPRFFHRSKQEARAITAELRPQESPPRRDVVTVARPHATMQVAPTMPAAEDESLVDLTPRDGASGEAPERTSTGATSAMASARAATEVQPMNQPRANSVDPSWAAPSEPPRAAPRDVAEPLTANLRRLHVTVSPRFLSKLDAARDALAHSRSGATTEDVLEAALDLLLAQSAKRKAAAVKMPRAAPARSANPANPGSRHVPAAVRREVWARDEGRCQWPVGWRYLRLHAPARARSRAAGRAGRRLDRDERADPLRASQQARGAPFSGRVGGPLPARSRPVAAVHDVAGRGANAGTVGARARPRPALAVRRGRRRGARSVRAERGPPIARSRMLARRPRCPSAFGRPGSTYRFARRLPPRA